MFQNGQKVVVVSGGDPTRVVRVQEATGTDTARYPTVTTDGVVGRDQQVQIVTGYDPTRAPYLIGVNSFSPLDLSPVAWFRYGIGVTSAGGFASVWADQSGNGDDLEQATGTNQPAYSGGIFTFDGADNRMRAAAFTLNQPFSVFLLAQQNSWTSNEYIFDGDTLASTIFRQITATPQVAMFAGSAAAANGDFALGAFAVAAVVFNGASSSIKINNNAATTGNAGAANAGGFALGGAGGAGGAYSAISVKEVVVFPTAITGADLTNMIDYLAGVGGLSI